MCLLAVDVRHVVTVARIECQGMAASVQMQLHRVTCICLPQKSVQTSVLNNRKGVLSEKGKKRQLCSWHPSRLNHCLTAVSVYNRSHQDAVICLNDLKTMTPKEHSTTLLPNQQQPGVCVHLRTLAAHKNPNDTGAYRYRCSSSAVRSRWQQHQGASGTIRTAVFSVTRALKWTSAASVSQSQLPLAFNKHLHEQKAVFVSFCGGGPPPLCVRFCHFAFAFLNLCQWHQHEVYPDQVGKDVGHVPRHTWKQVED